VDFLSGTGTATGFLFVDRDALPGGFAAEVYSPPVQTVPEPATVAMIASGLPLGLVFWCWKRRRAIA
jgi:hypothetical protein